jgi:hypothetical protein
MRGRSSDLRALVRRFPVAERIALGINLASIIFGNAYALWLVWHGALHLSGLILLVLAEGVLLSMLEPWQRARVPVGDRMRHEVGNLSLPQTIVTWTAFMVGVGGAYVLWIYLENDLDALIAFCTTWSAWRSSGLDVAVAMTLLFALAGMSADRRHHRQCRPPMVERTRPSTPFCAPLPILWNCTQSQRAMAIAAMPQAAVNAPSM